MRVTEKSPLNWEKDIHSQRQAEVKKQAQTPQGPPQGHSIRKPSPHSTELNKREDTRCEQVCVLCVGVFYSCKANAMKMRSTNKQTLFEIAIFELRTRSLWSSGPGPRIQT